TPIMVSWPGHVTPGRHEALASTIDLAPTILRACKAPVPKAMPGCDLISLAKIETAIDRAIFGEIFSHDVVDVDDPSRSLLYRWLIRDRWKLIVPTTGNAQMELYDLFDDPSEEQDLAK